MKGEVRWGLILKWNSFRHFWRILTIYSAGHFRETQFSITASLPEHLQGLHLKDVIFQLFLFSLVIYFLCFIASRKAEKNSFWEKHGIELQKIQCFWSSEFNFFLFDYPTIYISLTYPKRYIMFHIRHLQQNSMYPRRWFKGTVKVISNHVVHNQPLLMNSVVDLSSLGFAATLNDIMLIVFDMFWLITTRGLPSYGTITA